MGRGCHRKCVQLRTKKRGVTPYLYLFLYFRQYVFLSDGVSYYLYKLNLTFIQIRFVRRSFDSFVRQKRLFVSNEIGVCCHEISFFYCRLFLQTKFSQNPFGFSQIES